MDVLRTGCSMLGNLEMETSFDQQQDVQIIMLTASQVSFVTGTAARRRARRR